MEGDLRRLSIVSTAWLATERPKRVSQSFVPWALLSSTFGVELFNFKLLMGPAGISVRSTMRGLPGV